MGCSCRVGLAAALALGGAVPGNAQDSIGGPPGTGLGASPGVLELWMTGALEGDSAGTSGRGDLLLRYGWSAVTLDLGASLATLDGRVAMGPPVLGVTGDASLGASSWLPWVALTGLVQLPGGRHELRASGTFGGSLAAWWDVADPTSLGLVAASEPGGLWSLGASWWQEWDRVAAIGDVWWEPGGWGAGVELLASSHGGSPTLLLDLSGVPGSRAWSVGLGVGFQWIVRARTSRVAPPPD
jgi:hypothetical protein